MKYDVLRLDLPCYCLQVVDAKTGQEVNEDTEAAGDWVDEYEKFRATEADEWVRELTAANAQKVCRHWCYCGGCRCDHFSYVFWGKPI